VQTFPWLAERSLGSQRELCPSELVNHFNGFLHRVADFESNYHISTENTQIVYEGWLVHFCM
jgi:hypothetical protein